MAEPGGAIGIFDSGVGGLTVFRQIARQLPNESILYLGDTARVPYGTKSRDTVIRYAHACSGILLERGVKLLIVACNTASAFAVESLSDGLDVPVIGVVEPGARAAVACTRNGRIGVIGTAGTVASGAYPARIGAISPEADVFCKPCPLFVPLAEEGWIRGDVPSRVAHHYLAGLVEEGIDTLVLGCTHYPLLSGVIRGSVGEAVTLVDSAEETAKAAAETLSRLDMAQPATATPSRHFLVSDAPESFARIGTHFLGAALEGVEWLDF